MLHKEVKKYCEDNQRGPMYSHYETMVKELFVPSRPLTEKELETVTRKQRGYGSMEHT